MFLELVRHIERDRACLHRDRIRSDFQDAVHLGHLYQGAAFGNPDGRRRMVGTYRAPAKDNGPGLLGS